jgi:hypothetical protein
MAKQSKKNRRQRRHTKKMKGGNDKLKSILQEYFGKYGDIKGTTQLTLRYKGESNNNKNKCFKVFIDNTTLEIESLKYPNETNCLLKGPEILIKLYEAAMYMKLHNITLYDSSEIFFDNCSYSLAGYYILMHGISWYNSFGYYSKTFKDEYVHNENTMSRQLKFYYTEEKSLCDDIVELVDCTYDDTIQEIGYKFNKLLLNNETTKCGFKGIVPLFIAFLKMLHFKYDRQLSLDLKNPDIKRIYNIKKEKMHTYNVDVTI